jgi:hypothetical protein
MIEPLDERLNKALDRLLNPNLLGARGIGNEIPFHIFDYPPERELHVRERISALVRDIARKRPDLRVAHINLFDLVIDHLQERGLLEKAVVLQKAKGDAALRSALAAPLQAQRLAEVFVTKADPASHDLVLLSGVGSAYPLVRSHNLLNGLHAVMGDTPLVMFYPGHYDGQTLRLFDRVQDENYYRAFRLVP